MKTILSALSIQQLATKQKGNIIVTFDFNNDKHIYYKGKTITVIQQCFECFTNLLFMHISTKVKVKDKLCRIITYLKQEMQSYNSNYSIDLIIGHDQKHHPAATTPSLKVNVAAKIEKLFQELLKYCIPLSQYSDRLDEFDSSKQFLFDFIEKLRRIRSNNQDHLSNMYLLLGNLYLKNDILEKAFDVLYIRILHLSYVFSTQILNEAIIVENINLIGMDSTMYQIILCSNYNLGVIAFTIGHYHKSKKRMEITIEFKEKYLKEVKDQQMGKMNLTLSQIGIELINSAGADQCPNKTFEGKEYSNDIEEEYDQSYAIKEGLLKQFLYNNANDDIIVTNNKTNNSCMLKHFGNHNKKQINPQYKLIQDLIIYTPPIFNDEITVEQFFLFITQLFKSQIRIFNKDQPEDNKSNKRLLIPLYTHHIHSNINNR